MRVEQLMSQGVVTIAPEASGRDAAARMVGARVRHLPVVNRDGALVGVVTDRDLRHHLFLPQVFERLPERRVDALLESVRVADVMSTDVVSVGPDASLTEALDLMRTERIGSLPVVAHGRLVGILTETDMLRHIVGTESIGSPECAEIIVSYP